MNIENLNLFPYLLFGSHDIFKTIVCPKNSYLNQNTTILIEQCIVLFPPDAFFHLFIFTDLVFFFSVIFIYWIQPGRKSQGKKEGETETHLQHCFITYEASSLQVRDRGLEPSYLCTQSHVPPRGPLQMSTAKADTLKGASYEHKHSKNPFFL